MLNLERSDLRLLLAALKDAKMFNQNITTEVRLGRDDKIEARLAVEDFNRLYTIIHSEFLNQPEYDSK
jgi:hypothetical protein